MLLLPQYSPSLQAGIPCGANYSNEPVTSFSAISAGRISSNTSSFCWIDSSTAAGNIAATGRCANLKQSQPGASSKLHSNVVIDRSLEMLHRGYSQGRRVQSPSSTGRTESTQRVLMILWNRALNTWHQRPPAARLGCTSPRLMRVSQHFGALSQRRHCGIRSSTRHVRSVAGSQL